MRKLRGIEQRASERNRQLAQHGNELHEVLPSALDHTAEPLEPRGPATLLGGRRHRLAAEMANLIQQPAIMVGQADKLHRRPDPGPPARQPLQDPRAEGVELIDIAHVDHERARVRNRRAFDERLELGCVDRRPRASRGKLQPIIDLRAGE